VFELIKKIRPHFFSLREIDNNVSLDIRIPLNWKYEEIVKPYREIKIKVQDKNDKFSLLSLISNATEDGYNVVFTCALEIIVSNKEEEEKQKLLQLKLKELQDKHLQKVKHLQDLFKKESLDNLKAINLYNEDGQEITSSDGLVGEGEREGQLGDIESQESDD